jgi:cathepsin L
MSTAIPSDIIDDDDDDASEDNNPKLGRPGIVVFSGGTAFNAASVEMASRNVDDYDIGGVSRSNSLGSLVDLLDTIESKSIDTARTRIDRRGQGIKVWHVLPVTDDGGSTAEIVRVLGGPAVGDIRSRLLRLAPGTTREARAVRKLLGHRLISHESLKNEDLNNNVNVSHDTISTLARSEWLDILEGGRELSSYRQQSSECSEYEHPLWKDVSAPYRSIIRSFLVHFHNQVLQTHNGIRQSHSHPSFDFTGGSVGNFFFAGARTFFGSLPAAIFLFSKIAMIPSASHVIPILLSEERWELGAELLDGMRIRGQYSISHPKPKHSNNATTIPQSSTPKHSNHQRQGNTGSNNRQVVKSTIDSREAISSLHSSPIKRITYLLHDPIWQRQQNSNSDSMTGIATTKQWMDRHVVYPEPNPHVIDAISNANCIVYGCGSLFTSLIPCLVLNGIGSTIGSRRMNKVLLLNGWHDYETSWADSSCSGSDDNDGDELIVRRMNATSIVQAVVQALDQGNSNDEVDDNSTRIIPLVTDYITHIFYPSGTEIDIDEKSLAEYCMSRDQAGETYDHHHTFIQIREIESIPANTCSEGRRSGGTSNQYVFNPRALVDALLGLATGSLSNDALSQNNRSAL